MERVKIHAILFVFFMVCQNTVLRSQTTNWMDGTWIGIAYQVGIKDTWKIVLKNDFSKKSYAVSYPTLNCQVTWDLLQADTQKASFQQKITQSAPNCNQDNLIVITKISEEYVTYSSFLPQTGELFAYATLVKVDENKFADSDKIKIENNACENLFFDLEKGTLNGLQLGAQQKDIKNALPCFTGDSPDGAEYNCGGGVFFLGHGFFFYSGQDYIEVRSNYLGKMTNEIMHRSPQEIEQGLGYPDRQENVRKWDGTQRIHYFYKRKYGCLSVVFVDKKVVRVAAHATSVNETKLCY
ncbi:MAG: hypothetical protein NW226_26555 [Microscillaceae bacterium]|nr:hypothetical protein [Microscillaceae bacterium]